MRLQLCSFNIMSIITLVTKINLFLGKPRSIKYTNSLWIWLPKYSCFSYSTYLLSTFLSLILKIIEICPWAFCSRLLMLHTMLLSKTCNFNIPFISLVNFEKSFPSGTLWCVTNIYPNVQVSRVNSYVCILINLSGQTQFRYTYIIIIIELIQFKKAEFLVVYTITGNLFLHITFYILTLFDEKIFCKCKLLL